jgi:hypothetical protein
MKINLYVDDERKTGARTSLGYDGHWERAYNFEQALEFLVNKNVGHIALDHDLGAEDDLSGYDIACWIEQNITQGLCLPRMTWEVHSMNPSGAQRIRAAMTSCDRLWTEMEEQTAITQTTEWLNDR